MLIIGDVHGKIKQYLWLIKDVESSFQIGDMGIGFPNILLPTSDNGHKFIRGNHDNPSVCRQHPNYAGEFGYIPEKEIFFMGGAWSIDKEWRIPGYSWWPDEELSWEQMDAAYELYVEKKPKIVLTHDCPDEIGSFILASLKSPFIIGSDGKGMKISTQTAKGLQRMLDIHKPEKWIFGHWHQSWKMERQGTRFICLNELETLEI